MRGFYVLVRRELMAYFLGPSAYLFLAGFLAVQGYWCCYLLDIARDPVRGGLDNFFEGYVSGFLPVFMLLMVPVITMRLLAEEKRAGTLETLATAPIGDATIVLAKFSSAFLFYVFLFAMTFSHVATYIDHIVTPTWKILGWTPPYGFLGAMLAWGCLASAAWALGRFSDRDAVWGMVATAAFAACVALLILYVKKAPEGMPDITKIAAGYVGALLLGATLLSVGLLFSALAQNQVTAAILSGSGLGVYLLLSALAGQSRAKLPWTENTRWAEKTWGDVLGYVSMFQRPQAFNAGQVQLDSLLLALSVIAFFLFATVKAVESRKWR